jgi:hypothetical protein
MSPLLLPMAVPLSSLIARWVGVPGTWSARDTSPWWSRDSAFAHYIKKLGIFPLRADDPYVWSTDLNGKLFNIFGSAPHSDWSAAGAALSYYLRDVPLHQRNLIAHSHGLQAVLYACGKYGVALNTLTSVSSPVRKDMMDMAERSRPLIGYWTHVHSDHSDRTQWLGTLFDGAFGIVRAHPLADLNVKIPQVGHSDILNKSQHFSHWDSLLYPIYKDYGKNLLSARGGATGTTNNPKPTAQRTESVNDTSTTSGEYV